MVTKKNRDSKGSYKDNQVNIDWEVVKNLVMAGCKGVEIAGTLGFAYETLTNGCKRKYKMRWQDKYAEWYAKGDGLLRAVQFEKAVRNKDNAMLMFLGKNRLGQSEKGEITYKGAPPCNIVNYSTGAAKRWVNPVSHDEPEED